MLPELLSKEADAPVKPVPLIIKVWLPVPSPDKTDVGVTDVIVGACNTRLLLRIFLRVLVLASKTINTSLLFASSDNSAKPVITVLSKCSSLIASSAILVALIASAAIFAVDIAKF